MIDIRYRVECWSPSTQSVDVECLNTWDMPLSFVEAIRVAEKRSASGYPAMLVAYEPGKKDWGHIRFSHGSKTDDQKGRVLPIHFLTVISGDEVNLSVTNVR